MFPFWELFLYLGKFCLVRVIAKKVLRDFWLRHSEVEQQLKAWYHEAEKEKWRSPVDVKRFYPAASILPGDRIVFNIKGNKYRIVVRVNYAFGVVWIRFVGSHADYDKIDATTI